MRKVASLSIILISVVVGVSLSVAFAAAKPLSQPALTGVERATYDREASASQTLTAALSVVATPTPGPTAIPTPRPTPVPGRPVLTILSYAVEPARVVVGQEFAVTVQVYNTGSRAGENTIVSFPGGTFVPVGETGHVLGQLHINHTAVVTQVMRVPGGLSSGSYNLQINLSANDYEGNHYEYPQNVAVEVIGIGHGRPQLVIEAARTEPPELGPGDAFSLTLTLANRGDRTATDVLAGAASADLAVPADGGSVVAVQSLGVNRTATMTLPLVLGQVTESGRLGLEVALEYSDYTGGSYAARQSVGLEVRATRSDRPQLLVAGYGTVPDPLAPGDIFTLTLTVSNVGGGEARRLTLTLGGEGESGMGPFGPVQSSNVKFVPLLTAGDTVEVVQRLVVDGSADPGAYSLPVVLTYDDAHGTRHSDSQLVSLLVRRRPHLQIGFYAPLGEVFVGERFPLPVEVTNIGRSLVNVSTLEVTSERLEIEDGTLYLGPLDGGTSGSLEATAVAQEEGKAEVVVTVRYLDDFDQPREVTERLTVEVKAPLEPPSEGKAEPEAEAAGFWDKVLRFLQGLLGLGS